MSIWVFNGTAGQFPSGVFSTRELAETWIRSNCLSGVLTSYPLDIGVYDWAVKEGFYRPKEAPDPQRVGKFSSAYQEHYHYENGTVAGS
jgi:hypothetical protein